MLCELDKWGKNKASMIYSPVKSRITTVSVKDIAVYEYTSWFILDLPDYMIQSGPK